MSRSTRAGELGRRLCVDRLACTCTEWNASVDERLADRAYVDGPRTLGDLRKFSDANILNIRRGAIAPIRPSSNFATGSATSVQSVKSAARYRIGQFCQDCAAIRRVWSIVLEVRILLAKLANFSLVIMYIDACKLNVCVSLDIDDDIRMNFRNYIFRNGSLHFAFGMYLRFTWSKFFIELKTR